MTAFGIRYSVFGIRYSVFGIRYSVFGIRYSVNGSRIQKNQLPAFTRGELVIVQIIALQEESLPAEKFTSSSYDSFGCVGSPSALASEEAELGIPSKRCITISGLVSL